MFRACRQTDQDVSKRRHRKFPDINLVRRILFGHIFTLFNAVNALLAAALILVGSRHNLLFLGVAVCNTVIGITQELRCALALRKLSLIHTAKARVRRNGTEKTIPLREIAKGDRLLFSSGDIVGADAILQSGAVETDESLLTGETTPVCRQVGEEILSGSGIASGSGEAIAVRTGNETYAARLSAKARILRHPHSRLLTDINRIIRFTSLFMIPFAILLIWREWSSGSFTPQKAVTSTAAALLGMMPQGLILLTSAALMTGVVRLARKRILVQDLYGVESLARVSLLCLDKTGTLTTGNVTVCRSVPPCDYKDEILIGTAVRAIGDRDATAHAIGKRFPATAKTTVLDRVPFSPSRKYSAVSLRNIGTIVFGAPDRLFDSQSLPQEASALADAGYRLLAVAFSPDTSVKAAMQTLHLLTVLVLEDALRDNTEETLAYFQKEGVTLRVLSGDHPDTVAAVAAKAGLPDAARSVDASSLTTAEELEEAAKHGVVFGRLTPEQKEHLIRCFKAQGHTVGMVGDGVNDVLALKEADCSVAMAAGSDAAKRVSRLILSDSDFGVLPAAMAQGRRVIRNITRTASLFLVKTVMSFLLTLCTVLLPMTYPFEPLQLTLIGMFAESVPAFFLTLEPSCERIKGSFLRTVLKSAVPTAVLITVFVVLIRLGIAPLFHLTPAQSSTLCVYVTGLVWLVQLYRLCRPFTVPRRILCVAMTVGFFVGALLSAILFPATGFVLPTTPMLLVFLAIAALTVTLDHLFMYRKVPE